MEGIAELLRARPQCSHGWFRGPRCKKVATEWVGPQMYCKQHAKKMRRIYKAKGLPF